MYRRFLISVTSNKLYAVPIFYLVVYVSRSFDFLYIMIANNNNTKDDYTHKITIDAILSSFYESFSIILDIETKAKFKYDA